MARGLSSLRGGARYFLADDRSSERRVVAGRLSATPSIVDPKAAQIAATRTPLTWPTVPGPPDRACRRRGASPDRAWQAVVGGVAQARDSWRPQDSQSAFVDEVLDRQTTKGDAFASFADTRG